MLDAPANQGVSCMTDRTLQDWPIALLKAARANCANKPKDITTQKMTLGQ